MYQSKDEKKNQNEYFLNRIRSSPEPKFLIDRKRTLGKENCGKS